jgi:VIT1/CCC1 family predicted Fe2+/Mn2+ transporter
MALTGNNALYLSAAVCGLALFIIGAAISIFTRRNLVFSGLRMLGIGALAAGATYVIGQLLGVSIAS